MNVKIIKKFLFSMVLSLFSFFSIAIVYGAPESVIFDVEFADQHIYNFETGVFESSPIYASTGRMKIIKDYTSIAISTDFSYIYYWDKAVQYLGYRRNLGNYVSGSKYLGYTLSSDLVPSLPEGAVYFALSSAIYANNYTPSGMNTSIVSAFGSPSYLNYTDSVLTDNLGTSLSNPTYLDYVTEYNSQTLEEIFNRSGVPVNTQILSNPNFTTDISGYTPHNATSSHWDSAGTMHLIKNITSTEWDMYFDKTDMISGHLYYASVKCKNLFVPAAPYAMDQIGAKTTSGDLNMTITNPEYNTWYTQSTIFESNSTSQHFMLFAGDSMVYLTNGHTAEFDYFRLYDLTAIFGSGNEPDITLFEKYLSLSSFSATAGISISNYGYSAGNFDGETDFIFTDHAIPVLTLTNLLQNGQFSSNITGWIGVNAGVSWDTGRLKADNTISSYAYQDLSDLGNIVYYYKYDLLVSEYVSGNVGMELRDNGVAISSNYHNALGTYNNNSVLVSVSALNGNLFAWTGNTNGGNAKSYFDNVLLFRDIPYTKTQIDNALVNFGYLPYNVSYHIPDMGSGGTGDREFGTNDCGTDSCFIATGSGIGSSLELYHYDYYNDLGFFDLAVTGTDEWSKIREWRAVYGDQATTYSAYISGINPSLLPLSVQNDFLTDTADRDYYIDLYHDAVSESSRYEWYSTYGVTSSNLDFYTALYADAIAEIDRYEWYSYAGVTSSTYPLYSRYYADLNDLHSTNSADTYAEFQAIEITGVYDLGTPVDPPDVWDSFDNLFTPTIRIFIALIIVIATIVFVALRGGSLVVIVLIVAGELLFAVLANWIPEWVGIVLAIIAFLFFLFTVLKNDSGGGDGV